ncbi:predicted protein [Histoplasma capsulatum G186AR]|uniref:Uncharacterized protein n=1 Tax=Ajellomyces capsulatus (strain G186AR / H82 / ATCC MYA-2454 / RMSCC 2432) TaxID=447093 RepID=C0NQF3_AJECG|nr:uncharacterized protein HCBG_05741 [Histoplasma capsulatum G186AR]EEH06425.1 predicted protein [Histoplasma capsulatum G186AR]
MTDQKRISTGRGGAGNMVSVPGTATTGTGTGTGTGAGAGAGAGAATVTSRTPADLVTPTIKSDMYTTGRGGSGNIVANDDPAVARMAQDVEVDVIGESKGEKVFLGRGGAANIYDTSTEMDNNKDAH